MHGENWEHGGTETIRKAVKYRGMEAWRHGEGRGMHGGTEGIRQLGGREVSTEAVRQAPRHERAGRQLGCREVI